MEQRNPGRMGQPGSRLTHAHPGFVGGCARHPHTTAKPVVSCTSATRIRSTSRPSSAPGPAPAACRFAPRVASPHALLRLEGRVIDHAATVPPISMYSKRKPPFRQAQNAPGTTS
jgi:hypothetical protein